MLLNQCDGPAGGKLGREEAVSLRVELVGCGSSRLIVSSCNWLGVSIIVVDLSPPITCVPPKPSS